VAEHRHGEVESHRDGEPGGEERRLPTPAIGQRANEAVTGEDQQSERQQAAAGQVRGQVQEAVKARR
jgi:hypothetical protein